MFLYVKEQFNSVKKDNEDGEKIVDSEKLECMNTCGATSNIYRLSKTKILKTSALINFVLALFVLLFSFLYFKRYDLWFFIFSLFIGIYLLSRGALFKSDSSVYFGSLTFLIGVVGLLIKVFDLVYADIYYLLITALSSIIMVFGFKQVFHL